MCYKSTLVQVFGQLFYIWTLTYMYHSYSLHAQVTEASTLTAGGKMFNHVWSHTSDVKKNHQKPAV